MVAEPQVTYEYTNGNTIAFWTNDLDVDTVRPHLKVYTRIDGVRVVSDSGFSYRIFTFTAIIDGDDRDTLDTVQSGAIVYSGAYPRIQKVYWDADSFETNIEIAMMSFKTLDRGAGWWRVACTMEEKNQ